ncbi:amidohydrolase family protein [Peribacillus sp. NPDC097284]|uniref:amidohydrolase family protein n=1 Tax=Peribacillus sp. NPDC097284 TaxID=3364401 RepID=UPI00381C64FB
MLLRNATYLNEEYAISRGNLLIHEGKIVTNPSLSEGNASVEEMDCEGYILIPGLYNAHFHGYSLTAQGLQRDMKIEEWCNDSKQGHLQSGYFEKIDALTRREYETICMKAYADMVKKGITFVSESEPSNWPDAIAETINRIGMKGFVDTYEKIPEYHDLQSGQVNFGTHLLEEEDITDETLALCVSSKKDFDSLYTTHGMENQWRRDLIYSQYGKSSIELYKEQGLLDNKTIFFHGVHLNEIDIDLLAEAGSSVVHCPVSNLSTGAGIAPVSSMLEKGLNVCMGTDYASTDLWENMKIAYYLLKTMSPTHPFTAENIWQMATQNGASAYHQNMSGRIKDGFHADLVFIKKNPLIPEVDTDEFSTTVHNLLLETSEPSIHHVMVNGEWIMFNRTLTHVDEEEMNRAYKKILTKVYHQVVE